LGGIEAFIGQGQPNSGHRILALEAALLILSPSYS
jgi:hypothetical protein